jgi:hypothetical protein
MSDSGDGRSQKTADIFISYAREDRSKAERLANLLAPHGWTLWWDREIPLGRPYDEVIEEVLDAARCVVVLWSQPAVASRFVRAEARAGAERDILVPVLLDEVRTPLEFRSLEAAQLWDWHGEESHPEVAKLAARIGELLLGRSPPAPTLEQPPSSAPSGVARSGSRSGPGRPSFRLVTGAVAVLLAAAIAVLMFERPKDRSPRDISPNAPAITPATSSPRLPQFQTVAATRAQQGRSWCEAVAKPFLRMEKSYPFADATAEADLAAVLALFRPEDGAIWGQYDANLRGGITQIGKNYASTSTLYRRDLPEFLNRAQEITDLLFPSGKAQPGMSLEVRVLATRNVTKLVFELDGQSITYRNGPERWSSLRWPGDKHTGAAIHASGSGGESSVARDGEWGLLRLLDAAQVTKKAGIASAVWSLQNDTTVQIDFRPPRISQFLRGFTLPTNIVVGANECLDR